MAEPTFIERLLMAFFIELINNFAQNFASTRHDIFVHRHNFGMILGGSLNCLPTLFQWKRHKNTRNIVQTGLKIVFVKDNKKCTCVQIGNGRFSLRALAKAMTVRPNKEPHFILVFTVLMSARKIVVTFYNTACPPWIVLEWSSCKKDLLSCRTIPYFFNLSPEVATSMPRRMSKSEKRKNND